MGPCLCGAGGPGSPRRGRPRDRGGWLQHLGELRLVPDLARSLRSTRHPRFGLHPRRPFQGSARQGRGCPPRPGPEACHPKLFERKHPVNLKTAGSFSQKNNPGPGPPPSRRNRARGCEGAAGAGRAVEGRLQELTGGGAAGGNWGRSQRCGALGVEFSTLKEEVGPGAPEGGWDWLSRLRARSLVLCANDLISPEPNQGRKKLLFLPPLHRCGNWAQLVHKTIGDSPALVPLCHLSHRVQERVVLPKGELWCAREWGGEMVARCL